MVLIALGTFSLSFLTTFVAMIAATYVPVFNARFKRVCAFFSTSKSNPMSTNNKFTYTADHFLDVTSDPTFLERIGSIPKDRLQAALATADITYLSLVLASLFDEYIEIDKLKSSKFCKRWKKFASVAASGSDERIEALAKHIRDDILVVDESDLKDRTVSEWLKVILAHLGIDEFGGFEAFRDPDAIAKGISAISFIKEYKCAFIARKIADEFRDKTSGIASLIEFDQDADAVRNWLKVYLPDVEIQLMVLPTDHYLGNDGIAIAYTSDLTVTLMPPADNELSRKYVAKYAVLMVEGGSFDKPTAHVVYHGKSIGSKKDLSKRHEEDEFMASLVRSIPGSVIFMGDFNVSPESRFPLSPEDEACYPVKRDGTGTMPPDMVMLSQYDPSKVPTKTRTTDSTINPQAAGEKFGSRNDNTDMIFGRGPFAEVETHLFPSGSDIRIPLISENHAIQHLSDHAGVSTLVRTSSGKLIRYVVFNVLSDDASSPPSIHPRFSGSDIDEARSKFAAAMALVLNTLNLD